MRITTEALLLDPDEAIITGMPQNCTWEEVGVRALDLNERIAREPVYTIHSGSHTRMVMDRVIEGILQYEGDKIREGLVAEIYQYLVTGRLREDDEAAEVNEGL